MSAYLQITLKIKKENRADAAAVYGKYKQPFLDTETLLKGSVRIRVRPVSGVNRPGR